MTISDAIRLGAAVHPKQCFNTLFRDSNGKIMIVADAETEESCAVGAFYYWSGGFVGRRT